MTQRDFKGPRSQHHRIRSDLASEVIDRIDFAGFGCTLAGIRNMTRDAAFAVSVVALER